MARPSHGAPTSSGLYLADSPESLIAEPSYPLPSWRTVSPHAGRCGGLSGTASWFIGIGVLAWVAPAASGQPASQPALSQPTTTQAVLVVRIAPTVQPHQGQAAESGQSLSPLERAAALKAEGKWAECLEALRSLINQGAPAATVATLESVIQDPRVDDGARNWARVLLLNAYTHSGQPSQALKLSQAVLEDHAAGKAGDEQAIRALIWKARALADQERYEEAAESALMAVAVADRGHAALAYEAEFLLGEIHRWHADKVKGAENTSLHEKALGYYQAAFARAEATRLPGEAQDWARLQVGSELRHLGHRDRAVAWLRMGIEDPARLSETDKLLAERIGQFLGGAEGRAWHEYLLDPAGRVDPTEGIVQSQLGVSPHGPSAVGAGASFERLYWLGRLCQLEKRYEDAAGVYRRALAGAETAHERARALSALTVCHMAAREATRDYEEQVRHLSLAREYADRAAGEWLIAIRALGGPASHAAIESAIRTCWEAMRYKEAVGLAEEIVREADDSSDPSRAAFARFMLAQVYAQRGDWARAGRCAEEVWEKFGTSAKADVREVCMLALMHACDYYRRAGSDDSAQRVLDTLERSWGERVAAFVARERGRRGRGE